MPASTAHAVPVEADPAEELFDIVDEQGACIGCERRAVVHKLGLLHRAGLCRQAGRCCQYKSHARLQGAAGIFASATATSVGPQDTI